MCSGSHCTNMSEGYEREARWLWDGIERRLIIVSPFVASDFPTWGHRTSSSIFISL